MEQHVDAQNFDIKRNWKVVAGIAVLILVVVGLVVYIKKHNADQKGYTTFTSVDQSFSVQYPKNRDAQLPQSGESAISVSLVAGSEFTGKSNQKPYINIAKGAVAGNLDEEYETTVAKYRKLFKKMDVISENKDRVNGENARKIVFEGTMGGRSMYYSIVFIEYKGVIYTITAASNIADADNLAKELDMALSTWKFLQ